MAAAYDLCAPFYDAWRWQSVWHSLEWPILRDAIVAKIDGSPLIVDIGIGTGNYTARIRDIIDVRAIVGVDISKEMLRLARIKLGRNVALRRASVTGLPENLRNFDLALLCRVIGHVADPRSAFVTMSKVLNPGGILLLSDIAPEHPYKQTMLPLGQKRIPVPTYKHTADELIAAASSAGWTLLRATGLTSGDALRLGTVLPSSIDTMRSTPLLNIFAFQKVS